jgi:poly-gamma-glutamate synthesis protein (capsule biosynthesis protein)
VSEPKEFTFRAPPSALTALAAAGIDVANEANNHGIDFGRDGLVDTLLARAAARRSIAVTGIGLNAADAYRPFRTKVHGQRIAIISASQVIDEGLIASWTATDTQPGIASAKEVDRLLAAVRRARRSADTLVVFLHWGQEGTTCPTSIQQTLAAQLVAAGADIVVGSHSHRLEGAGRLGHAFVDYGLGNFAFYTGGATGVLLVTMVGRHVQGYLWVPGVIEGGVPHLTTDAHDVRDAVASWQQLRSCTNLAP